MSGVAVDRLIFETFSAEPGASRFWSKVRKGDYPGDCWIWTAAKSGDGYGVIVVGSRSDGTRQMVYAHRVSLILARHGEPLGDLWALHDCPSGDDPSCVNDAHLWVGNQLANMRDAASKGRMPSGDCHPIRLHPELIRRGERHHFAKLTDDLVRSMRERYAGGGISQSQLGREFGISSQGAVSAILSGKKWSHVS